MLRKFCFLICIIPILLFTFFCSPDYNSTPPPPTDQEWPDEPYEYIESPSYKILFIGASYFAYNKLTTVFNRMANTAKKEVMIDSRIILGTYLEDHARDEITFLKIRQDKWDFIILQGVGTNMAYPETADHPVLPALKKLYSEIKNNYSESKIVYCMPWAFEDGMLWTDGGTDDYFAMQQKIYQNTLEYSEKVDYIIAPVGWAWYQILKKTATPHFLHMDDYNHPSYRGTFLMACVIFSTIYRESILNLPYSGNLTMEEARRFQGVASSVVLENLNLWNIPDDLD